MCNYIGFSNGWHEYLPDPDNHLYLVGSGRSEVPGVGIRVINEPVLHFSLKENPECHKNYMIDRGERASGGAVFYNGDRAWDRDFVRFPGWDENGDLGLGSFVPDPGMAIEFINNAGSMPADGLQADFLHWASHGGFDGGLYDDNLELIYHPLEHGVPWSTDLEYVVLAACNNLNPDEGPFSGFINWMLMTSSPVGVHGIFGAHQPVDADLSLQFTAFYGAISTGAAIYPSYRNAMENAGAVQQPWAALIAPSYQNDTIREMSQSGDIGHVLLMGE